MLSNVKKVIGMSIAAVLSGVMLITTALAASSNVSGYENMKASAFALLATQNYTANVDFTVLGDGQEVVSGSFTAKEQDYLNNSFMLECQIGDRTFAAETSCTDGLMVTKSLDSDAYHTYDMQPWLKEQGPSSLKLTDNQKKLMNIVFDMMAGDTKNYFTNNDGHVSLKLEKNQIPEFVQVLMSVASEQAGLMLNDPEFGDQHREILENINNGGYIFEHPDMIFEALMIKMINNFAIESVYMDGQLDENNMLTDAEVSLTMSGSDFDGTPHVLAVTMHYTLSGLGETVADAIDLTGKEVVTRENGIQIEIDGDTVITRNPEVKISRASMFGVEARVEIDTDSDSQGTAE